VRAAQPPGARAVAAEIPADLPPLAIAPRALALALWHLLRAAGGGGRLTARRRGAAVEIAIGDDGPPLAPDDTAALFTPLSSTRPGPDGLGLDLPACKAIIQAHHGRLCYEADDRDPRAAVFRLSLPVADPTRDNADPAA
jgi:nitrogen-specific signal transduction histidine kinase